MNVARRPGELEPARRAVAIGTFDGVHRGHRRVIEAAEAAHLRSAVVTFDPHPRATFGEPVELLSSVERRLELLEALGVEDVLLLPFDAELAALEAEDFAEQMLRGIGAEVVAAGDGFRFVPHKLAELAPGVHVAQGYDFSDLAFVLTAEGIVAIDAASAPEHAAALKLG